MRTGELLTYPALVAIAQMSPQDRYTALVNLHHQSLPFYLQTIEGITDDRAKQASPDSRTVQSVVYHIAGWEQWQLLACGEIMAGVQKPSIMTLSGYKEPDGSTKNFTDVDGFNAYLDQRQEKLSWPDVQRLALYTHAAIHELFTHPRLLPQERLAQTEPYAWRSLARKMNLERTPLLPCAEYLWAVTLEHAVLEHAEVLYG